jgi:diacylglycerol kinase family enzyme
VVAGIAFVNPASGPDDCADEIRRRFAGHEIVEVDGDALGSRVRAVTARGGVDFVAVAGGDGSLSCAAGILAGGDVPLLPIPTGTRNHFARDLGIDSVEAAASAVDGERRAIDLGDVNGEVFVNNAGVGLYPEIVRVRDERASRLPKGLATLAAAVRAFPHRHRLDVAIDGDPCRVWQVFVGNGLYGEGFVGAASRDALDGGVLDLRVFSRFWHRRATRRDPVKSVRVDVPGLATVDVALDGEVVTLRPPLAFTVRPAALPVLVPVLGNSDTT